MDSSGRFGKSDTKVDDGTSKGLMITRFCKESAPYRYGEELFIIMPLKQEHLKATCI